MVAEQSGMKNAGQNGSETPPSGADGQQNAVELDSAHNQEFALTAPEPGKSRRKGRRDVRHTAEYLAARGRLPADSLHLIARRTLVEAVAYIRKAVPGCSHQWAAEFYFRCCAELLPYAHMKLAETEQPADPLGQLGLSAGHFLAASAFGMQTTLNAARGVGAGMLHNRQIFDSLEPAAQADHRGQQTMLQTIPADGELTELPPRQGRD